eukprot:760267-Hanusia_phi.AAC.9
MDDETYTPSLSDSDMGDALVYTKITQVAGYDSATKEDVKQVQDVFAGYHHFCYTDTNKFLRCWGYNEYWQLGYENMDDTVLKSLNELPLTLRLVDDKLYVQYEPEFWYTFALSTCLQCSVCPPGYFVSIYCSTYRVTSCQPCADNMTSPFDSSGYADCTCSKGFERAVACKPCEPGHYKTSNLNQSCPVPYGTSFIDYGYETPANCQCRLGTYGTGGSHCIICPQITYKDTYDTILCTKYPENTVNPFFGSSFPQDCECKQGYY